MSEEKGSSGWDKATELLSKAKETAVVGAKKAAEVTRAGMEKAQQTMDDLDKKAQEAKASKVASNGWDSAVEVQSRVPSSSGGNGGSGSASPKGQGGSAIFVDQSESIVSTIGSNYLQNFLLGGDVSKGVGVLTQKRFYYKGKNFSGVGKSIKSATEEGVISIEDITFTKFTHLRHVGFLFFAVLLTLIAIAAMTFKSSFAPLFLIALPFYILYFVKRESLFFLAFPGGGFAFNIRWYPIADIKDFQRQLHLLKDHIKEGIAV